VVQGAVCKTAYTGSIPVVASTFHELGARRSRRQRRAYHRFMSALRDVVGWLRHGLGETSGSLIVYGFLLVFVAITVIAARVFLGPVTSQIFQDTQCLQCT
jgi:hypothetical protein